MQICLSFRKTGRTRWHAAINLLINMDLKEKCLSAVKEGDIKPLFDAVVSGQLD